MKADLAKDGGAQTASDADKISIATLAKRAKALERQVIDAEERVADLKRQLRDIVADKLPTAMMAVGMESFKLADGSSLEIKRIVRASISEDNRGEAFDWLRQNNFGDLIKNQMIVAFDRGMDNVAGELADLIQTKYGLDTDRKESVNSQTLSKFVREQMDKGRDLPTEILGIYSGREAIIKEGKKA
jgi:hypothetical protein